MIKNFKVFFIFVKHGINPFTPLGEIKEKIRSRLTLQEKEYLIANTKDERIKEWLGNLIRK